MIEAAYAASEAGAHAGFFSDPKNWVAIGFLIFVALVGRKGYKAITGGLDGRAKKIEGQIAEADALLKDSRDLLDAYRKKQREAAKEADAILAHAKDEAERMRKEAETKAEESIKRREAAAMDKIAQAEAQAAQQVRDLAVDVAIAAASSVIGSKVDSGIDGKLIDESIKGLSGRFH